jgi:Major Facilitator Superfamily
MWQHGVERLADERDALRLELAAGVRHVIDVQREMGVLLGRELRTEACRRASDGGGEAEATGERIAGRCCSGPPQVGGAGEHDRRRVMSQLDGSIVLIALPAIFRGIRLDPLAAGNISYLLWIIMGYRLVQAVLVVSVGRLGDMFGRVRIYNAGFLVFTIASILLSFDPFEGTHGADWLIGWRVLQAIGGSMLVATSTAILTDAFPLEQRGFALGLNQVASLSTPRESSSRYETQLSASWPPLAQNQQGPLPRNAEAGATARSAGVTGGV